MKPITAPINPGQKDAEVANLQAALVSLLEAQVIQTNERLRTDLVNGLDLEAREEGYKDFTKRVVALYQRQRKIERNEGSGQVDAATADALNRDLLGIGATEGERPSIGGHVYFDDGTPAANIALWLYRKDFGGEGKRLNEAAVNSDKEGAYRIFYDGFGGRGGSVDVRTKDLEGKDLALATINVTTRTEEDVDLVLPRQRVREMEAEFTRLSKDLEAQLGDLKLLLKAQENGDRQDITYLRQTTGWDARLVALAATAYRMSEPTGMIPAALYGMFRAGLPTDREPLSRVESKAVVQALFRSRDAKIVQLSDDEVHAAQDAFEKFSGSAEREARAPGALSSILELFKRRSAAEGERLSDDEAKKFEELLLRYQAEPKVLWKKAEENGIPREKIDALQRQGRLAYLTFNNAALVDSLQQEGIRSLESLADKDLFREGEWRERLDALAGREAAAGETVEQALNRLIPPVYDGESAKERRDVYAADLARKVRIGFPTRVVARLLETDTLAFREHHRELKTPVRRFLQNTEPLGFQLGKVAVNSFLREHKDAAFQGISSADHAMTAEGVKTLQRLYQITPTDGALQVLLGQGFESAAGVVEFSPESFLERFGDLFASRAEAELVYRKAQQVSAAAHSVITGAKLLDSTVPLDTVSPSPEAKKSAKEELIKHFPTLESLLGSQDYCECEHCRSVLSPAAYFVDLLQFIDPRPELWSSFLKQWRFTHGDAPYPFRDTTEQNGFVAQWEARHPGAPVSNTERTPFDVLIERRPDLQCLELSCENTNTQLLYIDIVNTILEFFIADRDGLENAAYNVEGVTSAELLAEPHRLLRGAYEPLGDALYPLPLPFDLWLETVRRFFNHAEIPLAKVLQVFLPAETLFPPDPPAVPDPEWSKFYAWAEVFAESIGISSAEYALFTGEDPLAKWYGLYGYESEAEAMCDTTRYLPGGAAICPHLNAAGEPTHTRPGLPHAKTLARRLGVTYREIAEIVQSAFINPGLGEISFLWKLRIGVGEMARYLRDQGKAEYAEEEAAFENRLAAFDVEFGLAAGSTLAKVQSLKTSSTFGGTLILRDREPTGKCSFEQTWLEFPDGKAGGPLEFLKIALFVRLWRKLGWSLQETDRALEALFPAQPLPAVSDSNFGKRFAAAWKTALLYIAHLDALARRFSLGSKARVKLVSLWSDLATQGQNPLYAQLFLTRSVLKNDAVFDDAFGNYLEAPGKKVGEHLPAIQSAVGLSATEIDAILSASGENLNGAALTLRNVSLLYRHGLLAKALKLPVQSLLSLKAFAVPDPFEPLEQGAVQELKQDRPFVHTLRFVEIAEAVKASGFSIEDLDYLLRDSFDPAGKYQREPGAAAVLVQACATEDRRVRVEHAVLADPEALTDEVLRQKLGLILPPDAVETFLGMWLGTGEIKVLRPGVPPPGLDPKSYAEIGELTLEYNKVREVQTLAWRGFLTLARKTAVLGAHSELGPYLEDVQEQALAFIEAFDLGLRGASFEGVFEPVPPLPVYPPGEANKEEKEAEDRKQNEERWLGRRRKLSAALAPFLRRKLIQQSIVQTLAASLKLDPVLTETLLTNPALLSDPKDAGTPLIRAFEESGLPGVDTQWQLLSGPAGGGDDGITGDDVQPADPPDIGGVRVEGWLEVPAAGAYRFFAVCGQKDAEVDLRLGSDPHPLFKGVASSDGEEISGLAELNAGVPYHFVFEARELGGVGVKLLVQGENLPKVPLTQLTLYPQSTIDRVSRAERLLTKSLQFMQGFELSERELRYLVKTPAGGFNGGLEKLCAFSPGEASSVIKERFDRFLRIAAYAQLRRDLAAGPEGLISIFENARHVHLDATDADLARVAHFKPFAILSRRKVEAVYETAEQLGFAIDATKEGDHVVVETPALATVEGCRRLWEALQIVHRLGIPVSAIAKALRIVDPAATPDTRAEIARDLRNAVKARYADEEAWRSVAQTVFDPLRQSRRDALVAFITHCEGFASKEELFDYFLVDSGMEPVVWTSPVRLAIASVQAFINRILLNHEPLVHPSVIDAKRWATLQSYPVIAGAKRLFLHPENLLDEAFRDNKSHLFRQLESDLLGGPITNETVEAAFFTYLKGLNKIAQLQIVTMCREEKPLAAASNILHVFGRTGSQPHEYFYRRYASGVWSPWEPVDAPVEGDHPMAVIWRDRLHLFWLKFLDTAEVPEDAAPAKNSTAAKPVAELTTRELRGALKTGAPILKQVSVELHWSEFFQGKWSTSESSGFAKPVQVRVLGPFDPLEVGVHISKTMEAGEERKLEIHLHFKNAVQSKSPFKLYEHLAPGVTLEGHGGMDKDAVTMAPLPGKGVTAFGNASNFADAVQNISLTSRDEAFEIISRHAPPRPVTGEAAPPVPLRFDDVNATRLAGSGQLRITFVEQIKTVVGVTTKATTETRPILQGNTGDFYLLTCADTTQLAMSETGTLVSPFFYQDARFTFFVEPELEETSVPSWTGFGVAVPSAFPGLKLDEFLKVVPLLPKAPIVKTPVPIWIDPRAKFKLQAAQDWVTDPATVLRFDGRLVDQDGAHDFAVVPPTAGAMGFRAAIEVNAGSDIAPGVLVVASAGHTSDPARATRAAGLNVVGGGGLNATILENLTPRNSALPGA